MDPSFFPKPSDFREWLQNNHDKEAELWVGFYKKASGIPSITWPESVEEALCFGWIDGLRHSIDEKSYKIRFTPRKKNSHWSQVNLKLIDKLIANGKIQPAGLKVFQERNLANARQASYEAEEIQLSKEYENKLKEYPKAWEFFN